MRSSNPKSALTLILTLAGLVLPAAAMADEPGIDLSPPTPPAPAATQPAIIELQAVDNEQPLRVERTAQVSRVNAAAPMEVQPVLIQPQLGYAYMPCGDAMECLTDRQALKLALKSDAGYGAATGKMVGGIVVTAVGGAAAVLLGLAALLSSLDDAWCSDWDYDGGDGGCEKTTTTRDLGIGALVSLGLGLGVGLPLLISGATDRREIRRRVAHQLASQAGLSLSGGPGQAGLGLRYTF